jgi:hypothetical protein
LIANVALAMSGQSQSLVQKGAIGQHFPSAKLPAAIGKDQIACSITLAM